MNAEILQEILEAIAGFGEAKTVNAFDSDVFITGELDGCHGGNQFRLTLNVMSVKAKEDKDNA